MTDTDTEIHEMLVDSARRWAERACTPEVRGAVSNHTTGCPPDRWRELAELGWLGIALPERDGGMGAGLPEQCLLVEQLGRALLVEPFVASAVLGGGLLESVAKGELREVWLAALAAGERRVAWAAWEPDGATTLAKPSTTATCQGELWRLSGTKGLMPGAGGADAVLVTAQLSQDTTTTGLFLVEANAGGLTLSNQRLYDGRHAATLQLENTTGTLLQEGPVEDMLSMLNQALNKGRVAHCAETLGSAQAAFDITLEYVRTRRQFGKALGQNQVVQHRLVDLYVEIQEARALCLEAAAAPTRRHVAALGIRTGQVARHTWEEAIQLHGAIGMTDEYVLGAYVRRLALAADLYGTSADYTDLLADLSLGAPA
ncbi:acyl-CoA dehydrogenase family protein [Ottowia thiooxydans]|uniref:acyl-CoA dehydrogenase family protein n=1 Tax=Ottowia thiooxydans TaxID=219182 RepID=UPI000404A1D0|nr:acyl-CoA dehydrogenase family protein [Ottowia thiooxydans]